MKLALNCEKCNKVIDWPSHCGEPMNLEGDKVVCADGCGESRPVPECCGQPTIPFLVKS